MLLVDPPLSRMCLLHGRHSMLWRRGWKFHLFHGWNSPLVFRWHDDELRHDRLSGKYQMNQCWWFQCSTCMPTGACAAVIVMRRIWLGEWCPAATKHLWTTLTEKRCPVRLISSITTLDVKKKLFPSWYGEGHGLLYTGLRLWCHLWVTRNITGIPNGHLNPKNVVSV